MKFLGPVFLLVVTASMSMVSALEIPLYCADKKTYEMRVSLLKNGCNEQEISLGSGTISPPYGKVERINPSLEARFLVAQAAARKDGIDLKLVSGFRSYERQRILFLAAVEKYGSFNRAVRWVAPPEVSHHPLGLAIDVNYPTDPSGAAWLELNGYKYGLCRIFKNEWWHFEGVIAPGEVCPKLLKDARALLKK